MKIKLSQFSQRTEYGRLQLSAEASELGIAPGVWPLLISVAAHSDTWNMHRTSLDETKATYQLPLTQITAIIFND